jgi:hypothetical protein
MARSVANIYRQKKRKKRKGVHSKNLSLSQRRKKKKRR